MTPPDRRPPRARDVADLIARQRAGGRLKFLLFWGHTPSHDGNLGAFCLSQWYPAPFDVGGVRYATAEHFMMAEKARLFDDHSTRDAILVAASPGAAKALGRDVSGFHEQRWIDARWEVVVSASIAKYSQNPKLGAFLRGTAGRILVEASPRDSIWGIGLAATDPRATDPEQWQGLNLLGFALMEARDRLAG